MPSRAAPEISTFDRWLAAIEEAALALGLARALDLVAQHAAERFGARLRFVRILGRRWSFIAGDRSQTPGASPSERISLGGGVGLVSESWGTLTTRQRAWLIAFLRKFVSPGRQP